MPDAPDEFEQYLEKLYADFGEILAALVEMAGTLALAAREFLLLWLLWSALGLVPMIAACCFFPPEEWAFVIAGTFGFALTFTIFTLNAWYWLRFHAKGGLTRTRPADPKNALGEKSTGARG